MLQKQFRLRKNSHFSYTYKKGTVRNGKHFVLIFAKRRGANFSIGFCVSNKIGKANVRNLLKRRMRACTHTLIKTNNYFVNGYNYIFVARSTAAVISYNEILKDITALSKAIKEK